MYQPFDLILLERAQLAILDLDVPRSAIRYVDVSAGYGTQPPDIGIGFDGNDPSKIDAICEWFSEHPPSVRRENVNDADILAKFIGLERGCKVEVKVYAPRFGDLAVRLGFPAASPAILVGEDDPSNPKGFELPDASQDPSHGAES